jgi:chromosome segregation ATPase
MRTASVETEVPAKLEETRERALSAVEQLTGDIAEIEGRIDAESRSLRALDHEYEFKVVPPLTPERRRELSELKGECRSNIESAKAALAEKQSKVPVAAAALRDAETQVNLVVKASLVPRIEAATAELARMEENLQSEQSSLDAMVAQRREISHAVAIGKEKREKLQEIGARISDSQNHVAGVGAAIEPARTALDSMRTGLQEVEQKLRDAQNLADIQKLQEKGARVAKLVAGKLKEASEGLDSLRSLVDETERFLPKGWASDPTDVQEAARACRIELRGYDERARTFLAEAAGHDAVERVLFARRE